ncbi:alcohol dehydrogenase catalytic domain-containing protein [Pedobacter duraquae]|uniref:Alcohol dehydrogenase n=1 Tax=Pedobacter duraquae TaxID=425511 RepID=A0A4R6IHN8_9SPHI|nr:alcohol dehydrogenase catalytic domain-containing protein [Pedobacter duraquae]TDO20745.1 alcohol dehydrogenase [Pedobacter duraquae]
MNNASEKLLPGRAVLFNSPGKPFQFVERAAPTLNGDEILVRNLYTTICGSDIHTYCGHRSEPEHVVLGHEIVGEILSLNTNEEVKDYQGNAVQVGDRITWSIFAVPAGIEAPRADMPQKSDQLFKYGHALATDTDIFNGGLADYCVLRSNTAFLKIAPDVPLKVAATISCAHATVAGALRIAGEIKGKKVLVFGAGLLGISCAAMCKEAGASWIGLIDPDGSRLNWGTGFGTDETFIFPTEIDASQLPWPQSDLAFDMTGNPEAMKTGLDSLALGGRAIWIGAVFPAKPVPVDAQKIVRKLLEIKGLHNYNYDDFVNAKIFVERNYQKYPFELLIEKEYSLHEVEEAFRFATDIKPVRVGIKI